MSSTPPDKRDRRTGELGGGHPSSEAFCREPAAPTEPAFERTPGTHRVGRLIAVAAGVSLMLLLFLAGVGCSGLERVAGRWWELRRDSSGQAPDPATTQEAVIQVYAARAVGWRGVLAVHTWIALKPSGAPAYTRYEVVGWGVDRGAPAVRVNRTGPDNYWFGSRPDLLLDRRGEGVDELIGEVEAAVRAYPYSASYRTWPGPNSNTFTAYIGRAVLGLKLGLPPTAIGKDYLPGAALAGFSPSGTGLQLSLFGLAGLLVAWEEGLELNLLGLTVGLDVKHPALKLPAVGRLGVPSHLNPTRDAGQEEPWKSSE